MSIDLSYELMQRYYGLLCSLNKIGKTGNFFRDISCINNIFMEGQNIFNTINNTKSQREFIETRKNKLDHRNFEWLRVTRNKIVHQKSFPLTKLLKIQFYLPDGLKTYIRKNEQTIFDEENLEEFRKIIRTIQSEYDIKLCSFSVYFLYSEGNKDKNLIDKLVQMTQELGDFIKKINQKFTSNNSGFTKIIKQIRQEEQKLKFINLYSVRDYTVREDFTFEDGSNFQSLIPCASGKQLIKFDEKLVEASKLFQNGKDFLVDFKEFVCTHTFLFHWQKGLYSTIIARYKNNKIRIIFYPSLTKAITYRKFYEIANDQYSNKLDCVYFVGEVTQKAYRLSPSAQPRHIKTENALMFFV